MGDNFKEFIVFSDYVQEFGAVLFPEYFAWAKAVGQTLPSLKLDLPLIEKRAKIETVFDKRNPIYVQLSDGSKLFFTYDEFKRIDGRPERGKTMIVTMQRWPTDYSESPSQIVNCRVI